MADHPSIADWITAVSTAATAIVAGIAGFIAWLAYRRDARASLPIIEAELMWTKQDVGDYVNLVLIIRNQLYERISLDSAHVRRPKHMTISNTTLTSNSGGFGGVVKGTASFIQIGRSISPAGSSTDFYCQV